MTHNIKAKMKDGNEVTIEHEDKGLQDCYDHFGNKFQGYQDRIKISNGSEAYLQVPKSTLDIAHNGPQVRLNTCKTYLESVGVDIDSATFVGGYSDGDKVFCS